MTTSSHACPEADRDGLLRLATFGIDNEVFGVELLKVGSSQDDGRHAGSERV